MGLPLERAPEGTEGRQTAAVREQLADGDIALPAGRPLGEVLADPRVERQIPTIDELHDGRRGRDHLRERGQIVEARVPHLASGRRPVEAPVSPQPHDPVAAAHDERRAGRRPVPDRGLDEPVHAPEGVRLHPRVPGPVLPGPPHASDDHGPGLPRLPREGVERGVGVPRHLGVRISFRIGVGERPGPAPESVAEGVPRRKRDREPARDRSAEERLGRRFLRRLRPAPREEVGLRVGHRRQQVGTPERDEHGRLPARVDGLQETPDLFGEIGGVAGGAGPDVGGEGHGIDRPRAADQRIVDGRVRVEADAGAADAHGLAQLAVEGAARGEVVRAGEGHREDGARLEGVERDRLVLVPDERHGAHRDHPGDALVELRPDERPHAVRVDRRRPPVEAGAGLEGQHAASGGLDALGGEPPGAHRSLDGRDGAQRLARHEEHVGPRFERADGGLAVPVAIGDRGHVQRVGEQDAVEAEVAAQHLRHEIGRQRRGRRPRAQDRGRGDVGRHHGINAFVDRPAEGDEFEAVEPRAVAGDHRERDVGVGAGVPVTREVLGRREKPRAARAADERRAQRRHPLGILPE